MSGWNTDTDPEKVGAHDAQLRILPVTATDRHHGALVVAERVGAADKPGAYRVLQALGLEPDVSLSGERKWDRVGLGPRYRQRTGSAPAPKAALEAADPDCGSPKGAQAHHRADEPLCGLCQSWSDERHRRTRVPAGSKCGTASGAQMHRQLGEKVCDRCHEAESAVSAARHAATYKPKPPRPAPEPRTPSLTDRCMLLLAGYGAIVLQHGHYVTAAGDEVTGRMTALARAGWVSLCVGQVPFVLARPVLTDAGRAVLEKAAADAEAARSRGESDTGREPVGVAA